MSAAAAVSAHPSSDYRERVALLCSKFTRATGWTVRFAGDSLEARGDGALSHSVHSGSNRVGTLELVLPAETDEETRLRAQSATALLVEMLEELAASWRDRQQRDADMKRLVQMGRTVAVSNDGPEAVSTLLEAAVELSRTQGASFHLLNRDATELSLRGQAPGDGGSNHVPEVTRGLAGSPVDLRALVEGPQLLKNPAAFDDGDNDWVPKGTAAGICVPVVGLDGPLGTLWATTRRQGGVGWEQVEMLQAVATQMAGLLERLAIRDEQAIRERLMSELAGLSESHSGEQLGILPPGSGFDAVGRCRSRNEVGGDLCELVPLAEGRTLVAVGDACGHSVQAAFVMTAVRSAMSTVLDDPKAATISPTEVVARINRALCRVTVGHQFMSCLVGVIDSRQMTFTYSNAGHPVPILFRDGSCQSLESHGMPLGIVPDAEYTSGEITLRGQDVLVLFSDGVLETMNSENELFRPEGVMAAIESAPANGSLGGLLDRVWDASDAHGEGPAEDDQTLLVLRMEQRAVARPPHHSRPDRARRASSSSSPLSSHCS